MKRLKIKFENGIEVEVESTLIGQYGIGYPEAIAMSKRYNSKIVEITEA
jgi:hypothetical protein